MNDKFEQFKAFASRVREMAKGRWDRILEDLAPELESALSNPGKHVQCPVHRGTTQANFRTFKDVAETGGCVCNTCGHHADGFATLQWIHGWTFADAIKAVDKQLGGVHTVSQAELERQAADRARRAAAIAKAQEAEDVRVRRNLNLVWKATVSLTDPVAEPARKYLAKRGLPMKYLIDLRFHSALSYFDEAKQNRGRFPCIVARFKTADGRPGSLHRIYLTPEGDKLPLGDAKKMMAHPSTVKLAGGAIRLSSGTPRILGVAEGIETALAASALTGHAVWACYSATLLESFQPPAGVEKVIVFADLDRSGRGEEAAKKLVAHLWEQGITAGIRLPDVQIPEGEKGIDWNDVLLAA